MAAASDPRGIALKTVYQAPPLPRWTQAGLTFLGDAVHAMSPAGGLGANTALADAQSLATRLAQVCKGLPLGQALQDYEVDLRARGDRAVQQSADAAARVTGRG
jgi:salicylate hydroxylase